MLELHTNTELTRLIHQLTAEIHARLGPADDASQQQRRRRLRWDTLTDRAP
jgi:hypothetical protein